MRAMNTLGAILAVIWLVFAGVPAAASAHAVHTTSGHTRPFTLWLDWYPNSDHAGIYVALAKGYYARLGLDVQARVPANSADALKLVAHGSGDLAISYEPSILLARAAGIPIVATAAIVQRPLNCVMALKSSGITRPRQLEGKTVGIAGVASDYTDVAAVVRHDGGDPALVKTIAINYDLLQGLLGKRVDAVEGVYWTWEALQAQAGGHPVNIMRLDRFGVPPYDELVFATGAAQISHEAQALRDFQRATFEGYAYASSHPAEAARLLLKAPGVLSSSAPLIERSIRLLGPLFHDTQGRYGVMSARAWQTYADWMARNRLLSRHVDVTSAMTSAIVPVP